MNKILILNGNSYGRAVEGLGELCFNKEEFFRSPHKFKLVMFTGGEDIAPALYGHTSPKNLCYYNSRRDIEETEVFSLALQRGIKMTGICRGSQLLNVLSGGVMMHDITKHGSYHDMVCGDSGEIALVSSTHHQMSIPSEDGFVVGWSHERRSTAYIGDKDEEIHYDGPEVEAICYPNNGIFAVQYHPEYMDRDSEGYRWYYNGVKDLMEMKTKDFVSKYTDHPAPNKVITV